MPRLTANDFAPEVLELFDQYVHGQLSRRGFLDGTARYTTAGPGRGQAAHRAGGA